MCYPVSCDEFGNRLLFTLGSPTTIAEDNLCAGLPILVRLPFVHPTAGLPCRASRTPTPIGHMGHIVAFYLTAGLPSPDP